MSYTLEDLAEDISSVVSRPDSDKSEVIEFVKKALLDEDFKAQNFPPRTENESPRKVLYEHPEHGFCICAHQYLGADRGKPHDHGPTWAIYGQAEGETEMTDWEIVEPGSGDQPSLVKPIRTYTLSPGDAYFYDVGAVHSPYRESGVKLIRIEGGNLDHLERSRIKAL